MACSAPFSNTLKAFCGRFVTSLPFLSITLACSTTSRVSVRKIASVFEPGLSAKQTAGGA